VINEYFHPICMSKQPAEVTQQSALANWGEDSLAVRVQR